MVAESGTSITAYNNLVQDIYYIRYMIKNGMGVTSDVNTFIAKVDNIVPTLELINKGRYEMDNTNNIIQNVNYGISGASYNCINMNENTEVTTINSINKIGLNNISCTITSNAGLTSIVNNEYKLSATFLATDAKIGLTSGAYRNNSSIIVPPGGIQYGPYLNASKGCYRVFYYGNNLNAYAQGYQVIAVYDGIAKVVNLLNLNYVSSDSNYYFELTQDVTKLETKIMNDNPSTTITIDSFRIYYQGETCP
jgi:hypothetical protein